MTYHETEVRERLARAIHDDALWGSNSPGSTEDPPANPPWNELPMGMRRSVRRRADEVLAMLAKGGIDVIPVDAGGQPLEIDPTLLESLAEDEHKRWMRMRRSHGWRRGPVRNADARTHPSMIPYSELSESEREKDRVRVLRFPQLLASAGLGVAPR